MELLSLDEAEIENWLADQGEPRYRGRQIAQWVFQKGARSFEDMTNLPAALRQRLARTAAVGRSEVVQSVTSGDGVIKYLLKLQDRELVETVYLPYSDRVAVCASTQAGCSIGCPFCATGLSGFRRNVTPGEIVDQVLTCQTERRVSHVVLMGMGEPLLNLTNVLKGIHLLNHEVGIAARHITVSTVGIIPGIRRLSKEKLQVNLAVSLHAATDELRQRLVPIARKYPLDELMAACRDYVEATGRKLTFEYILFAGINDSPAHAHALASLLRGLNCSVNLIPCNPTDAESRFVRPSREGVSRFRHVLERRALIVTQRRERGVEIQAACGQLRSQQILGS